MKQVLEYGTSEKLLNIEARGIDRVKRMMMPELKWDDEEGTEKDKQKCREFLLINPNSMFKRIWSSILMVILIYSATIMPYRIAL